LKNDKLNAMQHTLKNKLLQLLILFLLLLTFNLLLFPSFEYSYAGEKLRIPDIRFAYSPDEINLLFNQLGATGRMLYTFQTAVVDMIYPLVYSLFLFMLFGVANSNKKQTKMIKAIRLMPFGIALFDYLENFNSLQMLSDFPEITAFSVATGSLFTSIKWILVVFTVLILLAIAVDLLLKYVRKRLNMLN
jgi:hypothetical protein